jgi:hypothetical protein
MPISRRMLVAGAATSAFALVGGAGFWRVMRRPRSALLPWAPIFKAPADVRLDAFQHAILAPNPHNRQPWLIRLDGNDEATISCDLAKRLPDTDPFDRQITIGFGTFLELARMTAAERGVRMEIEIFPEGEPRPRLDARPIAKLRFVPDPMVAKDTLFPLITQRRTNREVYDPKRPVPQDLARQIADGTYTVDRKLVAAVRAITVGAMTIEQTTTRTFQESIDLMRIGADEVDANPDGLVLAGPKMEALKLLGVLDKASLGDQSSTAFKTGLEMQQEICDSIPALLWITTPSNSRADQLEAGRRYVRANLRATMRGISMHPLSQPLQEYPEMVERFADIHKLLDSKDGERVQMLARIGYAHPIEPAPRWPLEAHFRT